MGFKKNAANECIEDTSEKGPPPSLCNDEQSVLSVVGNPINIAGDNKFQEELDYSADGYSSLKFKRTYNSLDGLWVHNYSTRLREAPGRVSIVMSTGYEIPFTIEGSTIAPLKMRHGQLSKLENGWEYRGEDNSLYKFNKYGQLTQQISPAGEKLILTHSATNATYILTTTVVNDRGQSIVFTADHRYQPQSLTLSGMQISYQYNSENRLIGLTKITGDQTAQRQFHYEDPRNSSWLTGITDERGVRYATWSYNAQGRAISSEHANGADKITVAYNADGSVAVTNEFGKQAVYRFKAIAGVKRITSIQGEPSANCPNSNSTFTYEERGLLKTKTDNKGHLTIYDYNDRGLEISRTEASGTPQARTITTEWHSTLFLPTVVTEPDRITRYQYDEQGRQLSRTVEAR